MEEISLQINEKIKRSAVYKEYESLKLSIEKSETLSDLKDKMESLKRTICKSKDQNLVDEYYSLEMAYKNNPLVKRYIECREDLNELLKEIVDILSLN